MTVIGLFSYSEPNTFPVDMVDLYKLPSLFLQGDFKSIEGALISPFPDQPKTYSKEDYPFTICRGGRRLIQVPGEPFHEG